MQSSYVLDSYNSDGGTQLRDCGHITAPDRFKERMGHRIFTKISYKWSGRFIDEMANLQGVHNMMGLS